MKYSIPEKEFSALRETITPRDLEQFMESKMGRYVLAWVANSIDFSRELNDLCDESQHAANKGAIGFGKAFFGLIEGLEKTKETVNHE